MISFNLLLYAESGCCVSIDQIKYYNVLYTLQQI